MRLLKWAGAGIAGVMGLVVVAFGIVYFQTESRLSREWDVNPPPVTAAQFMNAAMDGRGMDDGGARNAGGEAGEVAMPGSGDVMMPAPGDGVTMPAAGDDVTMLAAGGNLVPGSGPDAMAEFLEWGAHIAETRGCRDCHGEDLGGGLFADAMPVMYLYGANLTPGGVGAEYTDADWVRSIRHGVDPDGRALLFMPSYEYYYLGDRDLAALVAYLKSLPAVSREPEESRVGPLGRVLYATGKLPILAAELIDHEAPRPTAPPKGATVAYGEYLTRSCTGCHGEGLSGGVIPGTPPEWPPAANLTSDPETGLGSWSREDFVRAFTQGIRPDGRQMEPQFMPWTNFAKFEKDEVEAVWMYLRTVPAAAEGSR